MLHVLDRKVRETLFNLTDVWKNQKDAAQVRPYLPFGRRNKTIKYIYSKNLSISVLTDLAFFQRAASATALERARQKWSLITQLRD